MQIDGGHVKAKDTGQRSFEALRAKIYRPSSVMIKGKKRAETNESTCIASAKKDQNKTMRLLIEVVAKRRGISLNIEVLILADGANNYWNASQSLVNH